MQSAYHQNYSTEAVSLKIASHALDAANTGNVTLLGLLAMSATFDIIAGSETIEKGLHLSIQLENKWLYLPGKIYANFIVVFKQEASLNV